MRLIFTNHAWAEYQQWLGEDRAVLKRINRVIEDTLHQPFAGNGIDGGVHVCSPQLS